MCYNYVIVAINIDKTLIRLNIKRAKETMFSCICLKKWETNSHIFGSSLILVLKLSTSFLSYVKTAFFI